MKRLLIFVFTSILIIALLGGCGNSGAQPAANSNTPPSAGSEPAPIDKELEKAGEELDKAMEKLATPGWPTGKISDKIPEYPFGKVTNSGDFGDGEYAILISPTNKDELAEYLTALEAEGFTLNGSKEASLGTLELDFQFNSSEVLQMIVRDVGTSAWPDLLGGLLPPDKGTIYGEVYLPEMTASEHEMGQYYAAGFTLMDLTEEDCRAFIKKQVDNGWRDGGGDMAMKDIEIDGVACELAIQFVQYYEGKGDFNLEAWKKQ